MDKLQLYGQSVELRIAYLNYFYDKLFIQQQIEPAGLKLDKVENYY